MPIFLHLPAEMVVICNDVDIEAAIVIELDRSGSTVFCDFDKMQPYQLFIAACQLPRLWLLRHVSNWIAKEKSIGDRNCANPVLIIPLGRVLRELPKFSHVKKTSCSVFATCNRCHMQLNEWKSGLPTSGLPTLGSGQSWAGQSWAHQDCSP